MNRSEAGKLGAQKSLARIQGKKRERIGEYLKNPTICKNCSTEMPYEKRHDKFCNHSCSATFNNKGVRRYGKAKIECTE